MQSSHLVECIYQCALVYIYIPQDPQKVQLRNNTTPQRVHKLRQHHTSIWLKALPTYKKKKNTHTHTNFFQAGKKKGLCIYQKSKSEMYWKLCIIFISHIITVPLLLIGLCYPWLIDQTAFTATSTWLSYKLVSYSTDHTFKILLCQSETTMLGKLPRDTAVSM